MDKGGSRRQSAAAWSPLPPVKGVGDDSGIFSGNSFLQRCDGVVLGEKRFDLLRDAVEHRTEIADLLDKILPEFNGFERCRPFGVQDPQDTVSGVCPR